MSNVIYLDKNDNVICWGDSIGCKKYINQMYNLSLDNLKFEDYSTETPYSYLYEDYEVVNVKFTDIYLILGEVKMLREGCLDETRGIKYIQKELEYLSSLTNVFDSEMLSELNYMKDYMDKVYKVHAKYNSDNLFTNIDLDGLHSAYQMERENKGLPIVFIK